MITLNKTQISMLKCGAYIYGHQTRLLKHATQLVNLGLGTLVKNGSSYAFKFKVRLKYEDNLNDYLSKHSVGA